MIQETLLAVATALPRFDAQSPQSSFRGWLWTVALPERHGLAVQVTAITTEPLRPIDERVPNVPQQLSPFVMRMLARCPEARPHAETVSETINRIATIGYRRTRRTRRRSSWAYC